MSSKSNPKNLNGKKLPYKITLTNVAFAALCDGHGYIVAIEKDRYYILKFCSVGSNKSKYVSCEKYITK